MLTTRPRPQAQGRINPLGGPKAYFGLGAPLLQEAPRHALVWGPLFREAPWYTLVWGPLFREGK